MKLADTELLEKATALCRKSNRDPKNHLHMIDAAKEVFRADPDLGRRWKVLPDFAGAA